jgi:superfamily II DNA or RNA helicase
MDEVECVFVGLHPDHLGYLSEEYAVFSANYYFNPKFKLGQWDGKIRYFHKTGKTFVSLLDDIIPRIVALGYKLKVEDKRSIARVRPPDITSSFFNNIIDSRTGQPWEMRDYQIELVNTMFEYGSGVALAGTGAGKAQSLNSKVLTPTGWVRMSDLKLGDLVMTPNNKTAPVIGIFPQGKKQLFKLTFHDGSSTLACAEHLWQVKFPTSLHKASTEDRIVSTQDMINFLERKKSGIHTPGNISIPTIKAVRGNDINLTVHPYLLGALIGDGCLTQRGIIFSNKNQQVLNEVQKLCAKFDVELKYRDGSNCDYGIVKIQEQFTFPPNKNKLKVALEAMNLCQLSHKKFIPENYKQATKISRYQLIRGLMDTDGTVDKRGNISYTTTSEQLAKDVQEVVWSLGGVCTITSRRPTYTYKGEIKQGRVAYTCFIRHAMPINFFACDIKRDRCKQLHADGRIELTRRLINIEPYSTEEAQCIMLDDPKHLYITDDYIITHNTSMCAALALCYEREANFRSLIIVPDKNLTEQTRDQYNFFQLDAGEYSGTRKEYEHMHVVSTWQSLKNNPILIQDFQTIIVDECHGLKGNVLTKLLNEYGKDIPYRFGVTGTLPKEESDAMAVKIAVGPTRYSIPAYQLIEEGYLAELQIDLIQTEADLTFQYQKYLEEKEFNDTKGKPRTYIQFCDSYFPDMPSENRYLQQDKKRLDWLKDYILKKKNEGNTLVLVNGIAFGKKLTSLMEDEGAVFIYGKDKMKDRFKVYDSFETNDNLLVIANVQVASTGLDIPRIFNMISIDMGKSFIRSIQSIGRSLRKAEDKDKVLFTDICSNMKYSKKHMRDRIKYYKEAKYPFTKHVVDLSIATKYGSDVLS